MTDTSAFLTTFYVRTEHGDFLFERDEMKDVMRCSPVHAGVADAKNERFTIFDVRRNQSPQNIQSRQSQFGDCRYVSVEPM